MNYFQWTLRRRNFFAKTKTFCFNFNILESVIQIVKLVENYINKIVSNKKIGVKIK